MADAPPQIHLTDFVAPPWLIEQTSLTFRLQPNATRVVARIRFTPNPARSGSHDLWLDGENLTLIRASIDGVALTGLDPTATGLRVAAAALKTSAFDWEAEVEINPAGNTALEGLYMSRGLYCTQCEAEGFRKITLPRPPRCHGPLCRPDRR